MSNYPPGMTRHDWEHIDGEQHFLDCPANQDAYDRLCAVCNAPYITGYACPHCGSEPDCICDDIEQAIKDAMAELKMEDTL